MNKAEAKKRLAIIWFIGSGLLIITVIFQSVFGRYGEKIDTAWGWLLPTIMPTVSLITGVLTSDAMGWSDMSAKVNPFVVRVAIWLSIAYIIVVSLTIFLSPFSSINQIELMEKSNLWLAPFQGIVIAVVGAFFVNKPKC